MVQRKVKIIIALLCMFLFTGYTYPEGSPYLDVETNQGNFKIYFTTNVNETLIYDESENTLINAGSSTIYGYANIAGTEYRISFPTYDTPYYNYSYGTTYYLSQIEIVENYRVKLYSEFNADMSTYTAIIIIFLLFFIWFKG